MTEANVGQIVWTDLTVKNVEAIRDFYQQVVGWTNHPVEVDDYSDFTMVAGNKSVAGICHARGENADMPAQWLIYVTVQDLDHSIAMCRENGGELLVPAREAGGGRCAVIRDPAGACMALFEA
ncbi:MAG: VOC family protein [Rubripirellula sp.]|nr:VOC family protein [Rubripirellula sp.]